MHLAIIINQYPPLVTSGLGRYAEAIVPRLIQMQNRISLFSLNPGDLPRETESGELRVYRPVSRLQRRFLTGRKLNRTTRLGFTILAVNALVSNLAHVAKLIRIHKTTPIDLLVVHDTTNVVSALLLRAILKVPIVLHVHTVEYSHERHGTVRDPSGILASLERKLARRANYIVVPSPELKRSLANVGWPVDRIRIIPHGNSLLNPADPSLPDQERGRRLLNLPEGAPLVLFVGRLEKAKGVYELTEAFGSVIVAHPDAYLAFIGEGDDLGILRIAESSGSVDNVRVPGKFFQKKDLIDMYGAATMCVFPSHFEPFGLVALEAMSLGVPVILGNGFTRILQNKEGDPSVIYTEVAPEPIARTIIQLLDDPNLRDRMAKAARIHAKRFNWDETATRTSRIYLSSTDLPRGRGRPQHHRNRDIN